MTNLNERQSTPLSAHQRRCWLLDVSVAMSRQLFTPTPLPERDLLQALKTVPDVDIQRIAGAGNTFGGQPTLLTGRARQHDPKQNGTGGGIGALISEAYPTAARATAQNLLFNFGRAVGGLGPLLVGALAATYSFNSAIALLASIYMLAAIATVFLMPELTGKDLE
jgi:MFS family permease